MKSKKPFLIGEIGINHNGSVKLAKKLIDSSVDANFDAVKFQKRDISICIPKHVRNKIRNTPWGEMTYYDYKKKIEFGKKEYDIINKHCEKLSIFWTASCWDKESVDFIESYKVKFQFGFWFAGSILSHRRS